MKIPHRLGLVAALALGLAACGNDVPDTPAAKAETPAVGVGRFADLAFQPGREAPATAQGKNEARLAAEVTARIVAIAVDTGDAVKAGQVLVRLDPTDARLALARADAGLAQAEARLAQAEAQLKRAHSLREKNFISIEALTLRETEAASARADVQAARAGRDAARRSLEKCTVAAPFAGVVRSRTAQLGELASPGTPLLNLADTTDIHLVAQVQARDAAGLQATGKAEFIGAGRSHALEPLRVSSAVQREARTVEARFRFTSAPPAPGTEGRLSWKDPAWHLPPEYVLRRNGRYGVFVADGARVRFTELPEAQEGRPAPARLPPDTLIVTRGRHALQDGMAITRIGAAAAK